MADTPERKEKDITDGIEGVFLIEGTAKDTGNPWTGVSIRFGDGFDKLIFLNRAERKLVEILLKENN